MAEAPRRSTGALVRDLADDVQQLVRKEIELARLELMAAVMPKVRGGALIAGAFVISLPGLLFLFIALALALPVAPAAGFAIVGGALLGIALLAVLIGVLTIRKRRRKLALESIKEDVQWARDRLRR